MGAKKILSVANYAHHVEPTLRDGLDRDKILICDQLSPSEVIGQALDYKFQHICQISHPAFDSEINASALMVKDVGYFLDNPLTSVLASQKRNQVTDGKFELYRAIFTNSNQKNKILNDMSDRLKSMKMPSTLTSDARIVADELITNAIYNAPYVNLENENLGASRTPPEVRMTGGKSGSITLGINDQTLAICCIDPYGTLNIPKLLARVKNCFDQGVASNMRMNESYGAGIGSFMTYNASMSYYAVVEERVRTMICGLLPLNMSAKIRTTVSKNLHYEIIK